MADVRGGGRQLLLILIIVGAFGRFLRGGQMERKAQNGSSSLATSMTTSIVIAHEVTATMELHQINIVLEINISKQGIHPFGMTTRPANDEFAAGNKTVQQGDCLGEVSAVGCQLVRRCCPPPQGRATHCISSDCVRSFVAVSGLSHSVGHKLTSACVLLER